MRSSGTEVIVTNTQDEEVASADPEETAAEELEALNAPGAWEYGISTTYSLAKLGIDPARYDFPIMVNKQVLYYLELFQGKQRNYFTQWLARSSMYRPHIEAELKKAGLPLDLVFLAMIESGYNPSAYSSAKACGLWQFIESTGRRYGLRIDSWIDERRQPDKATKAAIRYLANLHAQFDDWYLAVAAYNAGERKIDTALKTINANDFWEIAASEGIFMETKRYVPKLIAAIIIARNPEQYGFTDIAYKKPQEHETITVPGGVSLDAVAASANTTTKELRALNNELKKNQTPPKSGYALRIPVGTEKLIAANLDKLRPVTTVAYITHTVKKDETLDAICGLYNISKTTLLKANNLKTAQLPKGLRLRIPSATTKYVLAKDTPSSEERMARNNGKDRQRQMAQYTLQPNAAKIAVAKNTKRNEPSASVPMLESAKKRSVAKAQPASGKKSSVPPAVTAQMAKEQPPTWYVVKNGDTLVTIAKKFQSSPQNIRSWNKLSGNALQTGDKLIVKKG